MLIHTIGFTRKTAEQFFETLRRANIERLIDVRLNNVSQLAGFAKKADLEFFLREINGADYIHELRLAPRDEELKAYRGGASTWPDYERRYLELLTTREVEQTIPKILFDKRSVLLCSEATAEHCHRRLAAEYLATKWGGVEITHL